MTGTGKTELVRWLIYWNSKHRKPWHKVYVGCPTAGQHDSYKFAGAGNITTTPSEQMIETIIAEQEQNRDTHICIVLDDVIGTLKLNSPIWAKLATSSRHWRITIFFIAQDLKKLPTPVRDNASTIFILGLKEYGLKACYDITCDSFEKFDDFKYFISQACRNKQAVRLSLRSDSEDERLPIVMNLGKRAEFKLLPLEKSKA